MEYRDAPTEREPTRDAQQRDRDRDRAHRVDDEPEPPPPLYSLAGQPYMVFVSPGGICGSPMKLQDG